jgi:nicotinamide mononucleotide transporter
MSLYTWLEVAATVFGLASVYLTTRQSIWCWPTGLVMVSLYVVIFFHAKLYSDTLLQVVYIFVQFYGWFHWKKGGGPGSELPVTRLSARSWVLWLAVSIAGAAALGSFMAHRTDASFPYADAAIASLSLVAQWLMARKVLENWHFWIAVDVLAIGVYLGKNLYLTTGLYAVFLGLCVYGLAEWRRSTSMHHSAYASMHANHPDP